MRGGKANDGVQDQTDDFVGGVPCGPVVAEGAWRLHPKSMLSWGALRHIKPLPMVALPLMSIRV